MVNEKEFGLSEKIGYTLAQMTHVLIWGAIFWLFWQVFVILGAPSVGFAVFVLIEAVARLIVNHLKKED